MDKSGFAENGIDISNPKNFINRELGLLQFQRRVFDEAKDERNPLLERVKFLSILGSNLDEFFMVRVGGLKMQNDTGVVELSMNGQTPAQQLVLICKAAHVLMQESRHYFNTTLLPELRKAGIYLLDYDKVN